MTAARVILILDMSYTPAMFQERQLEQALESRKLGGYFDRVISVHPLAGLFESGAARYGRPRVTRLDASHVFVEGRIGIGRWLDVLPPLNLLFAQLLLLRLVLRMSREAGVVVVRAGDPYYLGLLGWIVAKVLRVPLAVRVPIRYDEVRRATGRATMPRLLRFIWVEKRLERFIFPRCDLVAGANEDNRQYAVENGARAEVSTVFRYGNLLHRSHWTEPHLRPSADADLDDIGLRGARFVATVARLEPEKHTGDAIRAVGELVRRGLDVLGLIVGDGSQREELERCARDLGLQDRVIFAGNRTQEWLARVLPRASVIVSPHMGRALVEAALASVPLVAYDYDWQREVVVDQETGYLVGSGDWRGMTDAVERLLQDPALARRLGDQARRRTAAMMDPEALMRHEQMVYADLLDRWRTRSLMSSRQAHGSY